MTNIAIVEYLGSFPGHQPHGNSQKTQQDYIRTPGHIMADIGIQAKHRLPKQLYNDMNQDNSILEGPKDMKQIKNKKYHDKRKGRTSSIQQGKQVTTIILLIITLLYRIWCKIM